MKRTTKANNIIIGLILGLVLPLITLIVSWMIMSEDTFGGYLNSFYQLDRLANVISLAAVPNLLLFFIFIWTEKYRSGNGVIMATLVTAFIMLIIKFLL